MKKALTKYAIKNRFRVEKGKSAFKRYANNLKLINKHFKGEQGLPMIQHKNSLLAEFLKHNHNMKLNISSEALFSMPNVNDGEDFDGDSDGDIGESEIPHNLPSTRFNINNEDDLNKALEDSVKEILLQIEQIEASRSNLKIKR